MPAPMQPGAENEPIGIAAGGGRLPRLVADTAATNGWSPRILALADGIATDWAPYPKQIVPWGRLANGLSWLKAQGVRRMVLCGTISARPDFRSVVPSLRTLMLLPQILSAMRGGDDSLLRSAAKGFGKLGLEVIPVQAIAPQLLVPEGLIAGRCPDSDEQAAVRRGFAAAHMLGTLDVGQAVVASQDRVIALEGIEGTREMLRRVADLRARRRIGGGERCVLVKAFKPEQDPRFDLPSIGASTVEEAATAGLAGIAVSAGLGLIIGVDDTVAAAARTSMFIVGCTEATT